MKSIVVIAAALGGLFLVAGTAEPSSAEGLVRQDPACQPGSPVDQASYVEIGGIQQWVTIKGLDCANPVVLIVHGGPGNPNTPYADAVFGSWIEEFTLVQWDQRGSGMTFAASPPVRGERLTVQSLTQDGLEVARYAAGRLEKRQVILMGSSWGSALAVHMAQAQPDLFSGYVGSAQFVDYDEGLATSYDQTLNLAREAEDQDSLIKLEEIGRPPWTNPRAFGILRRVTRKYEAISTDAPPLTWYSQPAVGYDTPEYETAYSEGEDYSCLEFVGPNGDGMGPGIDLRQLGASFQMPVILLQGDDDLVTPGVMSRAYFDSLTAPKKTYIRLARTGHDLNQAMIGAQLEALRGLQAEAAADQ